MSKSQQRAPSTELADRLSRLQAWSSPQELADHLGVPVRTVYAWRTRGQGPVGTKVGRHVRYRDRDVEVWLERQRDSR
jgi:excisionase family DNA binding protein